MGVILANSKLVQHTRRYVRVEFMLGSELHVNDYVYKPGEDEIYVVVALVAKNGAYQLVRTHRPLILHQLNGKFSRHVHGLVLQDWSSSTINQSLLNDEPLDLSPFGDNNQLMVEFPINEAQNEIVIITCLFTFSVFLFLVIVINIHECRRMTSVMRGYQTVTEFI